MSILPFLALLCGPALDRLFVHRVSGVTRTVVIGCFIGISIGVQWLGMLVPFRYVQEYLSDLLQPLYMPVTFNRPAWSPLVLQWRFISAENIHFAWWRGGEETPLVDVWVLALPLAGAMIGAVLLSLTTRRRTVDTSPRLLSRASIFYGIGVVVVVVAMLIRLQIPLSGVGNAALADEIARCERAGDGIIHLMHTEAQRFANVYDGRLPTYGLEEGLTIQDVDELRLSYILARHERFWLVSAGRDSEWERALAAEATLVSESYFGDGAERRRLALYVMHTPLPES